MILLGKRKTRKTGRFAGFVEKSEQSRRRYRLALYSMARPTRWLDSMVGVLPSPETGIVTVRLLLGSVFSGNFMALIYSASGAFLCLIGMLLLKRIIDEKHIWIASVFGAVLHNTGQMIAAVIVTQTVEIVAYYPFLLVSGCLAGAFTGLCAQLIMPRIKFFKN